MSKTYAAITGVAGYVPDHVLTNKDLEKMVETSDEWIQSRTGIRERRILEEGRATSDMGAAAAKELLRKTATDPLDLELVICATVTPDMVFPDTATTICDKIGARNAYGFDLHAACSGFIYALSTGAQFIQSGTHRKVMIIGADKMSSIVDYTDRTTCVLFGDGAGAVLLEPAEGDVGIRDAVLRGDGSGREFLRMKAGGSLHPATLETVERREHFVYQDGRPVFKAAVKGMSGAIEELLERNADLSRDNIDWVVPHQANMRIITSAADFLNMPMEKVMVNIDRYGNTTAATIPLCLWEWEDKLHRGDNLVLTAFGGGYTWGATYVKWAYDGVPGT